MSFNFPNTPNTGDTYTPGAGAPVYRWDGEKWRAVVTQAATATVLVSDTAPATAIDGQLWWESDTGNLYVWYFDGDSRQWVICGQFASLTGIMRYDVTQGLTYLQQSQARANSGALKKNYLVNGAMMVSQENGSTASTVSSYFMVDGWQAEWSGTTAVVSVAQVASPTPGGSPNRIRCTVTTADTSMTTTKHHQVYQNIEGLRIADLKLGTALAKTVTLQFGVRAPAGTYCVSFSNSDISHTYVAEYTIAAGEANTDVLRSIVIPGDVAGNWYVNNANGGSVHFTLASGPTFQTAAGSWQSGNYLVTVNQFNLLGTVNNVFELFDVGLYEGNAAPPFQVPNYQDELWVCRRYYQQYGGVGVGYPIGIGILYSTTTGFCQFFMYPPLRASPTCSYGATTDFVLYGGGMSASAISSMTFPNISPVFVRCDPVSSVAGTTGGAVQFHPQTATAAFKFNARL